MGVEKLPRFAAIVPVSPKPEDARRVQQLVASLVHWEPSVAWCVIVDDCLESRALSELSGLPSTCRAISLLNPRRGVGIGHRGGIFVGIAAALSWIHANADVDFVIKLDPDALVIGRFSSYTAKFIDTHTEAGVIGALGCSCNPEVRAFEDLSREPELLRARRLLPLEAPVDGARMKDLAATGGFRRLSLESCRAIHALGSHIDDAIQRGYVSDENIQGGACVIARRMLDRMVERGYLTSPLAWAHIPVGDDRILAMYARAVDLRVVDCSLPGQPFGVQSIGLAYPPSLLLELGYTLIHSIKTDWIYSEDSIVTFFRDRIQAETTYPC